MRNFYHHLKNIVSVILLLALLCSCTGVNFSKWHFPYMMQVEQGKYITKKQFSKIKTGQTKEQVSYIIGHPLTQDLFDQNRWDFIYQDHRNNDLKKSYTVTLYFDADGKVSKIEKTGELFEK